MSKNFNFFIFPTGSTILAWIYLFPIFFNIINQNDLVLYEKVALFITLTTILSISYFLLFTLLIFFIDSIFAFYDEFSKIKSKYVKIQYIFLISLIHLFLAVLCIKRTDMFFVFANLGLFYIHSQVNDIFKNNN